MRSVISGVIGWTLAMITVLLMLLYSGTAESASQKYRNLSVTFLQAGSIQQRDTGTRPTCSVTYRGMIWQDFGGAGVADTTAVCNKDGSDAYAWRTLQ